MYGIEFEALKNFVSNTTILFVYLVPKGMCKPQFSNKDFFPLANVIIKKTPLHNGNSPMPLSLESVESYQVNDL